MLLFLSHNDRVPICISGYLDLTLRSTYIVQLPPFHILFLHKCILFRLEFKMKCSMCFLLRLTSHQDFHSRFRYHEDLVPNVKKKKFLCLSFITYETSGFLEITSMSWDGNIVVCQCLLCVCWPTSIQGYFGRNVFIHHKVILKHMVWPPTSNF